MKNKDNEVINVFADEGKTLSDIIEELFCEYLDSQLNMDSYE